MDFLCFVANHSKEYAINIADLVYIVSNPVVTSVPGTPPAIVGMTKFHGELIAVIDMSIMFSGDSENANDMLVFNTVEKIGVLIEDVHKIVRDDLPDGCEFIDIHDFKREILIFDRNKSNNVELF